MGELEKKALEFFGKKHQIIKTIEELGELQTALARYLLYNGDEYKFQVIEELVDCEIMLKQMQELFDISERLVYKRNMLYDIVSNNKEYRRYANENL